MYCQNCGVMNPEGAETCRICGAALVPPKAPSKKSWKERRRKASQEAKEAEEIRKELGIEPPSTVAPASRVPVAEKPDEPKPEELQEVPSIPQEMPLAESNIVMDSCPICGSPKDESENICESCKTFQAEEAEGPFEEETPAEEAAESSEEWEASGGDFGLAKIGGVVITIAGFLGMVYGILTVVDISGGIVPGPVVCFTGLMVLFGMGAIAGGYSAIEQKNVIYAIIGGVCGILSVGFYVGAGLSVLGLLLVIASYNDFQFKEVNLRLPK